MAELSPKEKQELKTLHHGDPQSYTDKVQIAFISGTDAGTVTVSEVSET